MLLMDGGERVALGGSAITYAQHLAQHHDARLRALGLHVLARAGLTVPTRRVEVHLGVEHAVECALRLLPFSERQAWRESVTGGIR